MSKTSQQNKKPFSLVKGESLEEVHDGDEITYYKARSLMNITGYFIRRDVAETWLEDTRKQVKQ